MTDVARRAVSRDDAVPALSRDEYASLVGDLMTREWIAVATGAIPEPRPGLGTARASSRDS
ncbi:hypothetical protein LV779_26165 [Streptomyces thinghirensis]|nr:hypothetical protein [Streptomyces thinghirensis]